MKRAEVLTEAERLISVERAAVYGEARPNFTRIGVLWGVMLDQPAVPPEVVAAMLACLKLARVVTAPGHADSWVDLAGYAGLGGELATELPEEPLEEEVSLGLDLYAQCATCGWRLTARHDMSHRFTKLVEEHTDAGHTVRRTEGTPPW